MQNSLMERVWRTLRSLRTASAKTDSIAMLLEQAIDQEDPELWRRIADLLDEFAAERSRYWLTGFLTFGSTDEIRLLAHALRLAADEKEQA